MTAMPPVVDAEMDEILGALTAEVARHRPEAAAALRPGLSEDALMVAERALGTPIHSELRQLFGWHNGMPDTLELFPGHSFTPLDDAVSLNKQLNADYAARGFATLMAHERGWLSLFPDPAGDGYYYDPTRPYHQGGVFYNFRETGYFIAFPSIKNLLTALVECFRAGAFGPDDDTEFELERRIMLRFGVERM